jgi:hypothetical protein
MRECRVTKIVPCRRRDAGPELQPVALTSVICLCTIATVLLGAIACIVPWLAAIETDYFSTGRKGNAIMTRHPCSGGVTFSLLQDVVGLMKSHWVYVVPVKVAVSYEGGSGMTCSWSLLHR